MKSRRVGLAWGASPGSGCAGRGGGGKKKKKKAPPPPFARRRRQDATAPELGGAGRGCPVRHEQAGPRSCICRLLFIGARRCKKCSGGGIFPMVMEALAHFCATSTVVARTGLDSEGGGGSGDHRLGAQPPHTGISRPRSGTPVFVAPAPGRGASTPPASWSSGTHGPQMADAERLRSQIADSLRQSDRGRVALAVSQAVASAFLRRRSAAYAPRVSQRHVRGPGARSRSPPSARSSTSRRTS